MATRATLAGQQTIFGENWPIASGEKTGHSFIFEQKLKVRHQDRQFGYAIIYCTK